MFGHFNTSNRAQCCKRANTLLLKTRPHSQSPFLRALLPFAFLPAVIGNFKSFTWSCQERQSGGVSISKHRIYSLQLSLSHPCASAGIGEAFSQLLSIPSTAWRPQTSVDGIPSCTMVQKKPKPPQSAYSKAVKSLMAKEFRNRSRPTSLRAIKSPGRNNLQTWVWKGGFPSFFKLGTIKQQYWGFWT